MQIYLTWLAVDILCQIKFLLHDIADTELSIELTMQPTCIFNEGNFNDVQ